MCFTDALDNYDGGVRHVTGPNATAGIWSTYPQDYVSTTSALADQVTLRQKGGGHSTIRNT